LWIAMMSSQYFLILGCYVAGEKNDRIFFFLWFLLVDNTCKEGTRSVIHFFVQLQICSWTAGVKVSCSS
jgi:hypothetical protein